jgi:Ca-activated chloride channel homolog
MLRSFGTLLVCSCLSHVYPSFAQSSQPSAASNSRTLLFSAVSKDSSPVELVANDLQLKEDGKPANITALDKLGRLPIHYCVLFDISRSEVDAFRFQQLETTTALSRVLKPGTDRGWIAFFNDEAHESTETDNPQEIQSVVSKFVPSGGTALYDAVAGCSRRMEKEVEGQQRSLRAMFLFTDGNDDASNISLLEVADDVVRAHVLVFAMTPVDELQRHAKRALEMLSQQTGGRVFILRNERGLEEAVSQISQGLENVFEATYTPASLKSGILKLDLKCQKKGLTLMAPEKTSVTETQVDRPTNRPN